MLLMLSSVLAQDVTDGAVPGINAQLFRPSIDSMSTLWTDQTLLAPDRYTLGRAVLHYANDPLVYVANDDDNTRTELVSGIWQLSLMGAHTRGKLRLGVDLPVYLRANGSTGGASGLGDVGFEARYSLLDRRTAFIGLAPIVRVTLPTTTLDLPVGNGAFGWEVAVAADKELGDNTVLAVNVGTRAVNEVQLENIEWDDQFFLRAGVGHALTNDAGVSLDFAKHATYGEFGNPAAGASEAIVGGWKQLGNGLTLRGGVGTGLNGAIGAPKYRLIFAVAYEPDSDGDADLDGILDSVDSCPEIPEDADGYMDADGCPAPARRAAGRFPLHPASTESPPNWSRARCPRPFHTRRWRRCRSCSGRCRCRCPCPRRCPRRCPHRSRHRSPRRCPRRSRYRRRSRCRSRYRCPRRCRNRCPHRRPCLRPPRFHRCRCLRGASKCPRSSFRSLRRKAHRHSPGPRAT